MPELTLPTQLGSMNWATGRQQRKVKVFLTVENDGISSSLFSAKVDLSCRPLVKKKKTLNTVPLNNEERLMTV
jgi:hypothetical protein